MCCAYRMYLLLIVSFFLNGLCAQGLDEELYHPTRNKLRYLLPDHSAAVFFSGETLPVWDSPEGTDFFRLTGINKNFQVLIVLPKKISFKGQQINEILFIPQAGQWPGYWSGPEIDSKEFTKASGIQYIASLDEFPQFVEDVLRNNWVDIFLFSHYPVPQAGSPFNTAYEKALGSLRVRLHLPYAYSRHIEVLYQDVIRTTSVNYELVAQRALNYLNYYPELRQDSMIQALANMRSATTFSKIKAEIENVKADITSLPKLLSQLREKKVPAELSLLKTSALQTARAMDEWIRAVAPDVSVNKLEATWPVLHGKASKPWSVLAGASCLYPHSEKQVLKLNSGELVRMQAGIRISGMGVSYMRTVPVSGKFSTEQRNILNMVLKAQESGLKALRPGIRLSEVNEIMRKSIASSLKEAGLLKSDTDLNQFIMHSCIRHATLSVFESDSDAPLEAGAVLNLMPAIYIYPKAPVSAAYHGIAIAVSDPVVLSSTGAEFLELSLPRTPAELESRVREPSILDSLVH